ncbi:MAG: methyltransferase domain-containing protein [Rhizobiales bacterium]|nr:methyltransferase domain-containing protein [Hyphomicrobiales bacterium]
MSNVNADIWNALYESGNYLHYPSEVFVQLYFRSIGKGAKSGDFLDYGCGSGNNSEFLARQGWLVTGADISVRALQVQKQRLDALGMSNAQIGIDGLAPIAGQLGHYGNIICWDCLCYNRLPKAKEDALALVAALEPGGHLFINMPTPRHEFATTGLELEDGSVQNRRSGTRQEGAIMAIPRDVDDLISWFPGLDAVQKGHFTFDFSGYKDFMFFVGRKPGGK